VERALHLLRNEVERDMIFMGAATLDQVNRGSIISNNQL
jgi:isopentenyl diphosphate isomerase/L-lactate dehydrogenase-like FMN-dependent dehydrogenase